MRGAPGSEKLSGGIMLLRAAKTATVPWGIDPPWGGAFWVLHYGAIAGAARAMLWGCPALRRSASLPSSTGKRSPTSSFLVGIQFYLVLARLEKDLLFLFLLNHETNDLLGRSPKWERASNMPSSPYTGHLVYSSSFVCWNVPFHECCHSKNIHTPSGQSSCNRLQGNKRKGSEHIK